MPGVAYFLKHIQQGTWVAGEEVSYAIIAPRFNLATRFKGPLDFMGLPAEIRVRIYHWVLSDTSYKNNEIAYFWENLFLPSLAYVSSRIRREFLPQLLKSCVFSMRLLDAHHWLNMLHNDRSMILNVKKVLIRIPHYGQTVDALPLIKFKATAPHTDVTFLPSGELPDFRSRVTSLHLFLWYQLYRAIKGSAWNRAITEFGITRVEVDKEHATIGKIWCNLASFGQCNCLEDCACKLWKFCMRVSLQDCIEEILLCDNESDWTVWGDGNIVEREIFRFGGLL